VDLQGGNKAAEHGRGSGSGDTPDEQLRRIFCHETLAALPCITTAVDCNYRRAMKKPLQTRTCRGFKLVGDTWIEHVTPAV
jgi:hypothetical protein